MLLNQKMDDHDKVLGSRVSSISRTKDGTGSPRLMRRPSLVGPSVAMGITTMSASDVSNLYYRNNSAWQSMFSVSLTSTIFITVMLDAPSCIPCCLLQ